jgi:hypothetical protein
MYRTWSAGSPWRKIVSALRYVTIFRETPAEARKASASKLSFSLGVRVSILWKEGSSL